MRPAPISRSLRRAAFGLLRRGLCLGAIAWVAAKPLPVPFQGEYQSENWSIEDGYPENSCSGIIAAPDGYLWIGTFRGLVRFNGQAFKPWAPPAMPVLRNTGILSMHRDRAGRIWFSTMEGLISNDGDAWQRWTPAEGWENPGDYVRSYAENAAGQLAFARFSGRVQRLADGKFRELPEPPGTGGALIALDAGGTLYCVRAGQARWFDGSRWQPIPDEPELGRSAVGAAQTRDGHALIVCRNEVLRLRDGRVVSRLALSQPAAVFWQMAEDRSGTLWFSAVDAGVYRIRPDGTVRHFLKADGLPHSGGTRIVHAADDGSLWIGSGVGGLTRFRPTRFRYLGEEEGMGDREVLTLTQLADGRMLFAPYGLGLRAFDGAGAVAPLRLGLNVPLFSRTILRTRDGVLWMGAHGGGLVRIEGGAATRVAPEFFPPPEKESVHTLFEDSGGHLWVGGEHRVLRQDGGGFRLVPLPPENAGRRPTLFAERRDGAVLLAQHHEVFVVAPGLQPKLLVRLPPEARISTLLVDTRDRVWIGTTSHGLSAFHAGRLASFPISREVPGATIGALVQDNAGQLWFGSGRSVVRADPDELWAAMQDPAREPRLLRFGRADGIRNLDFPYGTQPNVHKDGAGRLWFALVRGAAMVDPAAIQVNDQPPPVVIESISYVPDGAKQPVALALAARDPAPVLPAGSRLIKIDYAALDFSAPRKQRFRVALDGEWQDMLADTTVSFLELPPGEHTLHVAASGSDGAWNHAGATLRFTVASFYWQTGWFRALAGLGILGLVSGGVWLAGERRMRSAREHLERERRLAEAQARLALVLENTSDFVAFADRQGRVVYLNRAGRALTGVDAQADVQALPLSALHPPWAQERYTHVALPAAIRHGTWSGESAMIRRGGADVPVSQVVLAHRAADGALDFTSIIARDISAAKQHAAAQDALRRLATALTAALEPPSLGRAVAEACRALFAHDAFLLVLLDDAKAVAVTAYLEDTPFGATAPQPVNASVRHLGGRLAHVLEGRPLLVNREDGAGEDLAGSAAPWGATERRSRSIMYAPVRWEGHTLGVVSVQSYTARRYGDADLAQLETLANHCAAAIARLKAEALLRRNEEHLRQSQKLEAVGTLAGGIAHDFNNILTAILGFAELARGSVDAAHPSRDYLDRIRQSGFRARDLVRRILAFSRPQESDRRATPLLPVVEEVVKLMRSTTPATVEIALQADDAVPPSDIAPIELHQVLLNLGTNAAHALGNAPGRIEFSVGPFELRAGATPPAPALQPGRFARIVVSDTGCGIPAGVLPRIFDPFFTTKGPGQGSGLGLSVAHGIVHARGGAISVASTVGRGTTFTIYLPAASAPAVPATPAAEAPRPSARPGGRVLLVDDEEMIATTLRLMLTHAGYATTSFTSPVEALTAFRRDPAAFDLVLTDLSMPGMTGLTLTEEIRRMRRDLPIVLFSGYLRRADREAALQAGINEIVEKPVLVETLAAILARLLAPGRLAGEAARDSRES